MKCISFNVNGLRAIVGKNFEEDFKQLDADFFCLQETKMQAGQLDLQFDGYYSYFNYAERKGYSGTAIYTKHEPINVTYGIGIEEHDTEGRVITLEYDKFFFITVYTPNSGSELKRLEYRMSWEEDFKNYLLELNKTKGVVVCGDLNVAHTEIDLKNPKSNTKNAGFTPEEREKFTKLLDAGFTELSLEEPWNLTSGDYVVNVYGTTLFAFHIGEDYRHSLRIASAHTDFPAIRVKPNPITDVKGYTKLNVEMYGGLIQNTWLDRPLGAAGTVVLKGENPYDVDSVLFDTKRPIAIIPNLILFFT